MLTSGGSIHAEGTVIERAPGRGVLPMCWRYSVEASVAGGAGEESGRKWGPRWPVGHGDSFGPYSQWMEAAGAIEALVHDSEAEAA